MANMYVMIWAIMQLNGSIKEPIMEGAKRILLLAGILAVGIGLLRYNDVMVDFFITSPQAISNAILGADSAMSTVDGIWLKGSNVADSLTEEGSILSGTSFQFTLVGIFVYFITGVVCIYISYLFCLSLVAVGCLLAVGPLFIIGLMFDATKRFFEGWMGQLANYALVIILASVMCKILLGVLERYAKTAESLGAAVTIAEGIQLCVVCGLITIVMRQVPVMASAMSGGIALGTYSIVSRGIDKVRGVAGRTAYDVGRGIGDGRSGHRPSPYKTITRNMANRAAYKSKKEPSLGGEIGKKQA
jgi:type IV secretion system protein VirB6